MIPESKVAQLTAHFNYLSTKKKLSTDEASTVVNSAGAVASANLDMPTSIVSETTIPEIKPSIIPEVKKLVTKMEMLFAAAKIKDSNAVKDFLKEGIIPNCTGVHETCSAIYAPSKTIASESVTSSEGIVAELIATLQRQLDVNQQQETTIQFLTKANSEAAEHGFIQAMQQELVKIEAEKYRVAMQSQDTELNKLHAELEQYLKILTEQKHKAAAEREEQERLMAKEREEALRQQEEAIASERRQALARLEAEKVKIAARVELDKPSADGHAQTKLHKAVLNRNPGEVARLINAGATVDIPDAHKFTPLFIAACHTMDPNCVTALRRGGAPVTRDIIQELDSMQKRLPNQRAEIGRVRNALRS